VTFDVDKNTSNWDVNNQQTTHTFRFDGILSMSVTQADVFNIIAKPVIEDVLKGVNGTIFAYGQTGSGKTFTTTGGAQSYDDRGLIPRTIEHMFESFRRGGGAQYKMYISYLEIYNDCGYDLLRDDSARTLEELPKVTLREDEGGNIHLRGLSVNLAASEEDALNLLFLGDTNRVVAETPMNDASTRSHCLFIVWVDSTQAGSDVLRRSKLHLVDLAGSERVSRTGVDGNLLKEAKYINLSLHYLEQVIVALHERSKASRAHVPYRNSMMTSVLRDSLGGNCKTTMIGCIAVEAPNVSESMSTCRFAQRVAQIQNNAKVNEELDPNLLIARLKREVAELKEEVRVARSGEEAALTAEGLEQCRALVLQYVSKDTDPKEPFVCGSVERLRVSFKILRDLCRDARRGEGASVDGATAVAGVKGAAADAARSAALDGEARKLRIEIAQRDQEIGVLVQLLSKQRNSVGGADTEARPFITATDPTPPAGGAGGEGKASAAPISQGGITDPQGISDMTAHQKLSPSPSQPEHTTGVTTSKLVAVPSAQAVPRGRAQKGKDSVAPPPPTAEDAAELLLDKGKAFEVFRQKALQPESFEENKALLKQNFDEAKVFGERANAVRKSIEAAKTRLERLRTQRAMTAAGYDDSGPLEDGPEELAEVQEIERLKATYRESTMELRRVKGDIEGIQQLLERNKLRVQREFEAWFAGLRRQASVQNLDEDKKRELYERVTGQTATSNGGSCVGSSRGDEAAMSATPGRATGTAVSQDAVAAPASGRGDRLAVPPEASSAAKRGQRARTHDERMENDVSTFYAALSEFTKS